MRIEEIEADMADPKNPFYEENKAILELERLSSETLLSNLYKCRRWLYKTATGKDNSADFGFYAWQYEKPHKSEVLSRNLKKDMKISLLERYLEWRSGQRDEKNEENPEELYEKIEQFKTLKDHPEELYEKIEQFKTLDEECLSVIRIHGRLWDKSSGNFKDCSFEILKSFVDLLEKDKSLQELVSIIGRRNTEKEKVVEEPCSKVETKSKFQPKPAYKGEISGLCLSGEISSVLPSELAMSRNLSAKPYFAQKFAEKKLLSYAYINQIRNFREDDKIGKENAGTKETERKGPLIICVDTSGSMQGMPENIAKTTTFVLAKIAVEEKRKCYLISFSTGIETLDLSIFKTGEALAKLVQFLRMSFNEGTDVTLPLKHSTEMFHKKGYENADVLIISDFIMETLPDNLKKSIEAEKEKGTKFYSIAIGSKGNRTVTECFDRNWIYDLQEKSCRCDF